MGQWYRLEEVEAHRLLAMFLSLQASRQAGLVVLSLSTGGAAVARFRYMADSHGSSLYHFFFSKHNKFFNIRDMFDFFVYSYRYLLGL
jgi:hypothetical protein